MRIKHGIISIFAVMCLLACSCSETDTIETLEPQLVVEGYIDHDGFPVVMVTTSVATRPGFHEAMDSLDSHLLRWARVAISDGEQEVVLTGRLDRNYFPPYVYTTTHMRGKTGRTYTLTVDYGSYHATAVTTIPALPTVDSVWVRPVIADSLCSIMVRFTDDPASHNYYKAFVRQGRFGRQWLPAYLGSLNDEVLAPGFSELVVNQAGTALDAGKEYVPYFNYSDTVSVKFAQIDETAYNFWSDFDNNTNFARNPLFPSTAKLRGNVNGGFGCWFGCGAVTKELVLNDWR